MADLKAPLLTTPRTDAAERFFIDPGRPPVGFVSSSLARILEVELGRALAALAQAGAQAPAPLDKGTLAALQAAKRPQRDVLGQIDRTAAESVKAQAAAQAAHLIAALADPGLGQLRSYEAGDVLYRLGEQAENVFMLHSGQVQVTQRHAGPDVTLGPGQVLAAHSLFDDALHVETVHAVGPVQALLVGAAALREKLAADNSLLGSTLMGLNLQQRMVGDLTGQSVGVPAAFSLLGDRTYTGSELQRELLEAKSRAPGEGMSADELMCLRLQTGQEPALAVVRAEQSLGHSGQSDAASALMIVSGTVTVRWGGHEVQLGQGSVIGLAEALSGQAFSWDYRASQDLNVRQWPVERALQQIERAEPVWRALLGHFCMGIALRQREALA